MEQLWQNHRGRTVGLITGLVVGAAILCIGFWRTLFVLGCGLVGLWIGIQLDRGKISWELLAVSLTGCFSATAGK